MMKMLLRRVSLLMAIVLSSLIVNAQERTITGAVKDETGGSLPGATVLVKGTTIGALTDANGKFSIKVPANATTLVFSYIGMDKQDVTIGNQRVINITLRSQAVNLANVVVIGYGAVRKSEVTSSISSVSEKDLRDLVVTGVDQALQGKVAGLFVTNNSGQPGGGVAVRVRGLTTINSNDPLIVIDGVPFTSNTVESDGYWGLGGGRGQVGQSFLSNINPDDIASIDVLKDASAQAIYGSQAANGVILITTKKGKTSDGKVTYDAYYGTSQVARTLPLMDLRQFATYQNQIMPIVGLTPAAEFADPSVLGPGTDWQEAIFQTGITKSHSLSFSGANQNTNYYLSAAYLNQTGILIGSDYKRYSTRFSLDHQLKSWLKVGVSANILRGLQNIALADNAPSSTIWISCIQSPLTQVKNLDGTWGGGQVVGGVSYTADNPVADSRTRGDKITQNQVFGNIYADVKFLKDFSLRNEISYTLGLRNNMAYQIAANIGPRQQRAQMIEDRNNSYYYALRNYLNYNKTLGKHSFSATAGHEAQYSYWENIHGSKKDMANNILDLNTGGSTTTDWELNGGKGDWAMESYFARLTYTFDNKYSLSGSYRADASSNFGPNNKWGYFPGLSAGWTVTNERFMEPAKTWLSYMKVRVGYGGVGNQNLPSGAPNPPYSSGIGFWGGAAGFGTIGSVPTVFVNGIANPNLSWEEVITTNAGVDMGLFKNRLELTLDLYQKTTTKMLLFSTGPTFLGIGSAWNDLKAPVGNVGQMTNKGIDLSITSHNIVKTDLAWNTTLIFSTYKNKLDKLFNEASSIDGTVYYGGTVITHTTPGHPLGSFYGLVYDGLFRTQAELDASLPQFNYSVDQTHTWLGDVRYKDLNGDKKIDSKDLTYIGSPLPKFTFGLTNSLNFKNFDLSVFLQGSYGAKIYNYLKWQLTTLNSTSYNQLQAASDMYSASNVNSTMPRFTSTNSNNIAVSDRYVEDGSYLRVQNITLGYKLPVNIIRRVKLSSLRVYASTQNLYTFTKYSGYDPEIGSLDNTITLMNVDLGHYPNPRVITFGVNAEF